MKFDIKVRQNDKFLTVGNIRPNKTGKSWNLTIYADKTGLLERSKCGRFINALVTEDKRNESGAPQQAQAVGVADWLPGNNSLKTDLPF